MLLRSRPTHALLALTTTLAVVAIAGCSSTSSTSSGTSTPSSAASGGTSAATSAAAGTTVAAKPFKILVSNDDGYSAPGIAVLVTTLQTIPGAEITVSAPATNQSGTSDRKTDGTLQAEQKTTMDGYPATAVNGFPADSVIYGLDQLHVQPDLVVTGINTGQNIGPFTEVSGTVGAARTAARRGIPALALSQGVRTTETPPQSTFQNAAKLAKDWVVKNRDRLLDEEHGTGTIPKPVPVVSINVPDCPTNLRGSVNVPTAKDAAGRSLEAQVCESTEPAGADDVDAFNRGYASESDVGS